MATVLDRIFAALGRGRGQQDNQHNLTREHIEWAYRLFLDREPESAEAVTETLKHHQSTQSLRNHFIFSGEYRHRNRHFLYFEQEAIVIIELPYGPRLFINLADYDIGMQVLLGIYEHAEIALVQRVVKPGQRVLDIGANIGVFTMTLAQAVGPTGCVYAFEPVPTVADLLCRSVAENRFDWVTTERIALGSEPGDAALLQALGGPNQGGSYLITGDNQVPGGHAVVHTRMLRLDDYPCDRPISFIKIDVEGAEPLVMRGAGEVLRKDRPLVLCEICPAQLDRISGCTADAFIAEMSAHGYSCYHIVGPDAGTPMTHYSTAGITNVLFVPRERPFPA